MNRLTYNPHREDNTYMGNQNKEDYDIDLYKCVDKLGKLEDIEEELGIDLITLFKASKKGIFVEEQNTNEKEIVFEEITLDLNNKLLLFRQPRKEIGKGRTISQYGRTWALRREELDKWQEVKND